jgi:PAS domain S-box-containing protein
MASIPASVVEDLVFAHSPDAILITNADGRYVDANPAALALLGYGREELLCLGIGDVVASGRVWAAEEYARFLQEGSWSGAVALRAKDGRLAPTEARSVVVQGPDGPRYLFFLRELTERKRRDADQTRLALLVQASAEAIISASPDGVITDWNPAAARLYGFTAEEAIGQPLAIIAPPGRTAEIASLLARVRRGETITDLETVRRAKDGRLIDVVLTVSPVRDASGEIVASASIARDISAQKAAARALAASELRFRTAFEHAAIGMALVGLDGRFLQVNASLCELTDYPEPELLTRTFQDITYPADLEADLAYVQQLLAGQLRTYQMEKRYVRQDGGLVWIRLSASLVRDEDGRPAHFIAQVEDITARKQAEDALVAERETLNTVLETLPDAVYVKDAASRFLRLNPAAARILGITDPVQAIGKTDRDFFPTGLARQYFADEQEVIASGQPLLNRLEPQSEDADNADWWLTSTVPLRDAAGTVVGIVGIGRDITERLRMETALQESEARHRALLAALPDLVFLFDRHGTYLDHKADRAADLAAPADILLGRTVTEIMPSEIAAASMAAIGQVLDAGGTETLEYALELAGERRDFEARLVAAGPDEVVAVVRDVTERKRGENELRAALAAAEAANQATRQFVAMMSHELRTPIQAIQGYAELLLAGPVDSLSPEQRADVRTIQQGAARVTALVSQMLDLSRLQVGQFELDPEPVDLMNIIAEVRQDIAPQVAHKGLLLRIDVPRELPTIMADPVRLRQILVNLASNAVKFTEEGEVAITVRQTEHEVTVAVRDTGIGMAPEVVPSIFEAFRQVEGGRTRRYEGAGLGLAIASQLAERHGGTLDVESEPGVGSTFTLRLPADGVASET